MAWKPYPKRETSSPSEVRFTVVRKMLEDAGWTFHHVSGSHHVFTKPGHRAFPVPVHRNKVGPDYVREIEKLIRPHPQGR